MRKSYQNGETQSKLQKARSLGEKEIQASINKRTDLDKLFTEKDTLKQTNDVYKLLGSCRDVNKNKIVFEKNTAMLKTSTSVDKLMKHDEKDKLKAISKAILKVRSLSSFLLSLAEVING